MDDHSEIEHIFECRCRTNTKRITEKRQLTIGFYHKKLEVLSPLWQFAKTKTKKLINNFMRWIKWTRSLLVWLMYYDIFHLGCVKNPHLGKVKLRQIRVVMSFVEWYACIERCYETYKEKRTSEYTRVTWENVGTKYIGTKFGVKNRNAELS